MVDEQNLARPVEAQVDITAVNPEEVIIIDFGGDDLI